MCNGSKLLTGLKQGGLQFRTRHKDLETKVQNTVTYELYQNFGHERQSHKRNWNPGNTKRTRDIERKLGYMR